MNQILLGLGLDVKGWNAGLKSVKDDVKSIEQQWKGFGKILKLGGVVAVVQGVFSEIISSAQETRKELEKIGQPIPDSVRSVAAFGDALDEVKKKAASMAVTALSFFTRAGEGYGSLISHLSGVTYEQEAQAEASARNADKLEASLAKVREANSPEKVKAAAKDLAEFQQKAALDLADDAEKLNLLIQRRDALEAQVNNTVATGITGIEARKNLLQTEIDIAKQRELITKETVASEQATAAVVATIVDKQKSLAKERATLEKTLHDQKVAVLPVEEQIVAKEKDIVALKIEQRKYSKDSNEFKAAEVELNKRNADLTATQAELEEKRLRIMEGQAKAALMMQRAYEAVMASIVLGGHGSTDIQGASDSALKELLGRNNSKLAQLNTNPGDPFHFGNSLDITRLKNENRRLQNELDTRDELRADVSLGGVDGARRTSKLDPLIFDRLVSQFVTGQTEQGQGNEYLRQLTEIFKNQPGNTQVLAGLAKLTDATQVVAQQLARAGISTGG